MIVNEPWWTPVAQWADIVFPATTALEREDFCVSHDPYAHVMDKALPVFGQARSDHEIFMGLSRCLGLESEFSEGKSEMPMDERDVGEVTRKSHKRGV